MKKIIALAVASAFAAPVAMAEVTISGSLRPNVEYMSISGVAGQADVSRVQLVDNSSRIIFEGKDKLDSGLTLFWQVENRIIIGNRDNQQLSASTSALGFGSRDTFVGVKGNFGQVYAGRISDLTDSFNGEVATALASWNTASGDVRNFIINDTARLPNAAMYESPVFSGFQAKALYDFGGKDSATNYYGYQGQLTYKAQLFKVGAIYKQNNDVATDGNNGGETRVNGNYYKKFILGGTVTPMKGFDVSAEFVNEKTKSAGVESKQDSYGVGVGYKTGKHAVTAQYAVRGDVNTAGADITNSGAKVVALNYAYDLSKQTRFIATATRLANDANSSNDLILGGSGKPTTTGGKLVTVTAGLRTDF